MMKINLNADMGESFGAYTIGQDELLVPFITSANVACGFHAADPYVMRQTVKLLKEHCVGLGAHPGVPDLQGFGRRNMLLTADEAYCDTLYQLGALYGFAKANDYDIEHVKPHGALYNMAANDYDLAFAIASAVKDFDDKLIFLGLSGSQMIKAASACGLKVANEVFADRAYNDDGTLVNRKLQGAMIHDEIEAIDRVVKMIKTGHVTSINGVEIPIKADSICVHGDGPQALVFVKKIVERLEKESIKLVRLSQL